MTAVLKINEELNGIELYFDSKPDAQTRKFMKSNGFRFSGNKVCWWAVQSEKAFKIANTLTNNAEIATIPAEVKESKKQPKNNTLSLWNATQWKELNITEKQRDQDTKTIAKEIREHVRKRFPQVKFSVRSPRYSSISFEIVSAPYEKGSKYLDAVLAYCQELVNSYKYCTSYDPYGDYGSSYNFYCHPGIDWEYKQTEVTEAHKEDMKQFDIKLAEFEQAEEERKEQEYQEFQKQQAIREAEYKQRQEEEKKQTAHIYNSVEVKELEKSERYFITGAEWTHLNKNNTLDRYKEEVKKGEFYLEDVKITKEIHFSNIEALNNFSNMLLHDFDFLVGTGGSYTDDNRINSMTDWHNMTKEEQSTVKWFLSGAAIYFNNQLQFVVDSQGHSYARYVGLTDNATIEKEVITDQTIDNEELNELRLSADHLEDISTSVIDELGIIDTWQNESWKEYKEAFKTELIKHNIRLTKEIIQQLEIDSLKVAMYKILTEVDGIQEQFKNAAIQEGEKLTLFYISDWGGIVTNRITFDSFAPAKYAQYDNAVKITFTPEKKRKLHYKYFYSDMLVYKGFHTLPDEVLHHVEESNGFRTSRGKFHSCDKQQYDEIMNYFDKQGIRPIINTYKPQF